MTELALRSDGRALDPTGGRLIAWASSLQAAHQIGQALCATSFVPQHFRNKPEEAAAAILYGDEIGLTPTQSLQSVYVVSGKPALYARTMVAIVLAAGHEIETIKKTDAEVTVRGRRRGSSAWITETWTTARAKKAGYLSNKKYDSDPQSMLLARAQADVCRQVAPDALAGLAYSAEEMELQPASATVTVVEAPAESTVVRRNARPAPAVEAPEPAVDTETGEIVEAEVVDDRAEHMTPAQSKMMAVLMRELGITDRDDAIRYCSDVIGRVIDSRDQLTPDEASKVIDALSADKAAQDAADVEDGES